MEWRKIICSPFCFFPPGHKHVLTTLARYGDKWGGDIFPSQRSIAFRAGVALPNVNKIMKRAVSEGWITRAETGSHRGYKKHSYELCIPAGVFDLTEGMKAKFWLPPYEYRIVIQDGEMFLDGRNEL